MLQEIEALADRYQGIIHFGPFLLSRAGKRFLALPHKNGIGWAVFVAVENGDITANMATLGTPSANQHLRQALRDTAPEYVQIASEIIAICNTVKVGDRVTWTKSSRTGSALIFKAQIGEVIALNGVKAIVQILYDQDGGRKQRKGKTVSLSVLSLAIA